MTNFVISFILVSLLGSSIQAQYSSAIVVEKLLKTDTTSIGQKIEYPHFQNDEVSVMKVTIPPGQSTGWHKHGFPVFAYVVSGTLTVELENGKTLKFEPNSTFAEVINLYHNGKNIGNENVVLLAFYMGEKGMSLSIKKEAQKE